MPNAYIVDACRTPRGIGKVGKGALAHLAPFLFRLYGVESTGGT